MRHSKPVRLQTAPTGGRKCLFIFRLYHKLIFNVTIDIFTEINNNDWHIEWRVLATHNSLMISSDYPLTYNYFESRLEIGAI